MAAFDARDPLSRPSAIGQKPLQVIWLSGNKDDLMNSLTMVHSMVGMHPTAWSAMPLYKFSNRFKEGWIAKLNDIAIVYTISTEPYSKLALLSGRNQPWA
jgi:hypothetical protein